MQLEALSFPSPIKEDPTWYEWKRLLKTLRDPARNKEIRRELVKITRRIGHNRLITELADAINTGQAYRKLSDDKYTYVIRAASAEIGHDKLTRSMRESVKLLAGKMENGKDQPVQITVLREDSIQRYITAQAGEVQVRWSARTNSSHVSISLQDSVAVYLWGQDPADAPRRSRWETGGLKVPEEIASDSAKIGVRDIYQHPEQYTTNESILKAINQLKTHEIPKLHSRIVGEIHGRIAYGVSCFLLVAMGAALGLLFRGGQIISAFAISVVPAALVIIMVLMGKQLIRNPDVPMALGLMSIWAGILLLLAATVGVYAYLMRK